MTENSLWYKNDIFYELYVRAFRDSNADGWGDLKGVTEKLDYLSYLGVDTIWLLPISPSPLRDDGYDVSDYCGIHPMYGNMQDFQELVAQAHQRALKILVELVPNHTSDQHAWFQASRDPAHPSTKNTGTITSERYRPKISGRPHHLRGQRKVQLDLRPCSQAVFLAPLLPSPAGPELRQPGCAGSHAADCQVLD